MTSPIDKGELFYGLGMVKGELFYGLGMVKVCFGYCHA